MPFRNFREYGEALNAGKSIRSSFRKVPSQTTIAQWWFDLSTAAGNPPPNFYASAPLESQVLSGFRGIFNGDSVSPSEKYLSELMLVSPTAGFVGQFILLDYLLFYPFVDLDDGDSQLMTQVEALPRYEDGAGVQVMLVCLGSNIGPGTFTFEYTNQDGVLRTSPVQTIVTAVSNTGSLMTAQPAVTGRGPFLDLLEGDTGVRSIESLTMSVLSGGLGCLVMVKPLAELAILEVNTAIEQQFIGARPGPPRIHDGAYLNFIVRTAASVASGTITGQATFAWD